MTPPVVLRLTIFCPIGVIHLIFHSFCPKPVAFVSDTSEEAAVAGVKTTHGWNVTKKWMVCNDLYIIAVYLVFVQTSEVRVSDYVLWSPQIPLFTVMSSMAMNPSLLAFL